MLQYEHYLTNNAVTREPSPQPRSPRSPQLDVSYALFDEDGSASSTSATMEQATATISGGEPNPLDSTGLCLLSLDGGGVRGLSTLYILKSIMDRLNNERKKNGLPPVKPCEVFDLIGGTSTGGGENIFGDVR